MKLIRITFLTCLMSLGLTAGAQAATVYTQVEAGSEKNCALTEQKTVKCWGSAPSSMMGVRKASAVSVGVKEPCAIMRYGALSCLPGGARGFESLSLGGDTSQPFACAIQAGGALKCWGSNYAGQLGDGTTTDRSEPTGVSGDVAQVATGTRHACAIKNPGSVICWGDNQKGQLGNASNSQSASPVTVGGISGAASIAASEGHSCAVSGGTVKCWGDNSYGQLGDGTTTDRNSPVSVAGISGATAVSTGSTFSCALLAGGSVKCWGDNRYGQLGSGSSAAQSLAPVSVSGLAAVQISSALDHSCALKNDGSVSCWGSQANSKLGNGFEEMTATPVAVASLSGAQDISTGEGFSCALLTGGSIKCWGENRSGQLGDGTVLPQASAQSVPGISGATALDSGNTKSCVVLPGGTVSCWGDPYNPGPESPAALAGLSSVTTIAVGDRHGCARKSNGHVQCWGENNSGQLGTGEITPADWTDVTGLTDATLLAAGDNHTCALRAGGTVSCWGKNSYGQLGDGTTTTRKTPVAVSGLNGAVGIEAGGDTTCARLGDGTAKCWGYGGLGQLGNGQDSNSTAPVPVSGIGAVSDLSVGGNTACAVSSGSGYCWGYGVEGQLGNGVSGRSFSTPQQLNGNPAVSKVSGSSGNSCFQTQAGGGLCSGLSQMGALGNGQLGFERSPVSVGEPVGAEPDFFDPDAPRITNLELTPAPDDQVLSSGVTYSLTISWSAPEWDGDAPITEYQARAAAPDEKSLPRGVAAGPGFCKATGSQRTCTTPIRASVMGTGPLGLPLTYRVRVQAKNNKGPYGTWSPDSEEAVISIATRCGDPLNQVGGCGGGGGSGGGGNNGGGDNDEGPQPISAKLKAKDGVVSTAFKPEEGVSYSIGASKLGKAANKAKGKCKLNKKTKKTECAIKLKRGKWKVSVSGRKNGVSDVVLQKQVTVR